MFAKAVYKAIVVMLLGMGPWFFYSVVMYQEEKQIAEQVKRRQYHDWGFTTAICDKKFIPTFKISQEYTKTRLLFPRFYVVDRTNNKKYPIKKCVFSNIPYRSSL